MRSTRLAFLVAAVALAVLCGTTSARKCKNHYTPRDALMRLGFKYYFNNAVHMAPGVLSRLLCDIDECKSMGDMREMERDGCAFKIMATSLLAKRDVMSHLKGRV